MCTRMRMYVTATQGSVHVHPLRIVASVTKGGRDRTATSQRASTPSMGSCVAAEEHAVVPVYVYARHGVTAPRAANASAGALVGRRGWLRTSLGVHRLDPCNTLCHKTAARTPLYLGTDAVRWSDTRVSWHAATRGARVKTQHTSNSRHVNSVAPIVSLDPLCPRPVTRRCRDAPSHQTTHPPQTIARPTRSGHSHAAATVSASTRPVAGVRVTVTMGGLSPRVWIRLRISMDTVPPRSEIQLASSIMLVSATCTGTVMGTCACVRPDEPGCSARLCAVIRSRLDTVDATRPRSGRTGQRGVDAQRVRVESTQLHL